MKYDDLGCDEVKCICPICKEYAMMTPSETFLTLKCSKSCTGVHKLVMCQACSRLFDVTKYDNIVSRYNLKQDRIKSRI